MSNVTACLGSGATTQLEGYLAGKLLPALLQPRVSDTAERKPSCEITLNRRFLGLTETKTAETKGVLKPSSGSRRATAEPMKNPPVSYPLLYKLIYQCTTNCWTTSPRHDQSATRVTCRGSHEPHDRLFCKGHIQVYALPTGLPLIYPHVLQKCATVRGDEKLSQQTSTACARPQ